MGLNRPTLMWAMGVYNTLPQDDVEGLSEDIYQVIRRDNILCGAPCHEHNDIRSCYV